MNSRCVEGKKKLLEEKKEKMTKKKTPNTSRNGKRLKHRREKTGCGARPKDKHENKKKNILLGGACIRACNAGRKNDSSRRRKERGAWENSL